MLTKIKKTAYTVLIKERLVAYMPFLFTPRIKAGENAFFAAMNTPIGFRSCFTSLFSPHRQYIIKGGPGTGKSTLMKSLAAKAEANGLSVERYFCSSDSTSLDAVLIPSLSTVLLDGTSPHATEPTLFGVKDRYLDLSRFLDTDRLPECELLATLAKRKKEAYQTAYRALSALDATDRILAPCRESAFDRDKCKKTLTRLIERLGLSGEKSPQKIEKPISALSCEGYVALDSPVKDSRFTVKIQDRFGVAPLVFKIITALLDEKRVSYFESLSPLTLSPDTLYLPQGKILISTLPFTDDPAVTINCERFLTGRGQGLYKGKKALLTAEEALFSTACTALSEAASIHRESEGYYSAAMDFNAMNAYAEALLDEILTE